MTGLAIVQDNTVGKENMAQLNWNGKREAAQGRGSPRVSKVGRFTPCSE